MDNLLKGKVLVLLSGGIDSTACVEYYLSLGYIVSALFVDYSQPYVNQEKAAATAIAKYYHIPLGEIKISGFSISEGYIPARNSILLNLALLCFGQESGIVAIGIHSGTPYADCSPDFANLMQQIYDLYEEGRVRIDAPFLQWTKTEIWEHAKIQKVPLHLNHSTNLNDLIPVADQSGSDQ
jgi:7-cyano-7-deazaguanine synthase